MTGQTISKGRGGDDRQDHTPPAARLTEQRARNVLRPGGVLATTNPPPRAGARLNLLLRIDEVRHKRITPRVADPKGR
jgi:hypothetical protein